jgi:hypothetical protein
MEGFEKQEDFEKKEREEIFSKAVRAGKRTYFFDVKATRKNDYYLTVTESKKQFEDEGHFHYEKHKIFLYKEDFEKFVEGLQEAIDYIKSFWDENAEVENSASNNFTDVNFDEK